MATPPEKGDPKPRVILLNDIGDVRAWCNLWGCSEAQLRLAAVAVGDSPKAVHPYLLRNP